LTSLITDIYGNAVLVKTLGKETIVVPNHSNVVAFSVNSGSISLTDSDIESNGRSSVSEWNSLTNNMQYYIDNDLVNYHSRVASLVSKGSRKSPSF